MSQCWGFLILNSPSRILKATPGRVSRQFSCHAIVAKPKVAARTIDVALIYIRAIDNRAQNFSAISAIEVGSRAYTVAVNAIVAIALVKTWSRWSC